MKNEKVVENSVDSKNPELVQPNENKVETKKRGRKKKSESESESESANKSKPVDQIEEKKSAPEKAKEKNDSADQIDEKEAAGKPRESKLKTAAEWIKDEPVELITNDGWADDPKSFHEKEISKNEFLKRLQKCAVNNRY